ncbi:MAG: hypothetical protein U0324_46225 [Polyangiales bacterium]
MTAARLASRLDALSVTVAQFVVAFVCAEAVYTVTRDDAPPAPWWPCAGCGCGPMGCTSRTSRRSTTR